MQPNGIDTMDQLTKDLRTKLTLTYLAVAALPLAFTCGAYLLLFDGAEAGRTAVRSLLAVAGLAGILAVPLARLAAVRTAAATTGLVRVVQQLARTRGTEAAATIGRGMGSVEDHEIGMAA